MPALSAISRPHLLVVEGAEDLRFWKSLFEGRGRSDIEVRETEGKHDLRRMLATLTLATGFDQVRWLGVVQDADNDAQAAFDRICGALSVASLPVPQNPWQPTPAPPVVTAFVLPDGSSPGELETLLWHGWATRPAGACVDVYLACLAHVGIGLQRMDKARVYAYLASLPDPDLRLSHAILRGQVSSPLLDRFLALLPS